MAGIDLSWTGGLARLRLAEPGNRNAFNLAFCRAFAQKALDVAAASPAAILIEAEGDAFSVGGDIAEFLAERARIERHVLELASLFHLGIARLHGTGAPILVAVNAIAARSAKLVAAYTSSGLTPDGGGTWFLPRLVGWQKAFEILALNPVLSAEEAQHLGLVTRVVEDADFPEAVEALAQSVAAMPSGALVALKRLMRQGADSGLDAALDAEAGSIARQAAHPATLERLDAFMARSRKSR